MSSENCSTLELSLLEKVERACLDITPAEMADICTCAAELYRKEFAETGNSVLLHIAETNLRKAARLRSKCRGGINDI